MSKPSVITFTDYVVPISALTWNGPQSLAPPTWTRVKFNVPGEHAQRDCSKLVCEWLVSNCNGQWRANSFPDPRSKSHERTMIIKFESRDDALMFKLRGGHQAWEESS